jgi:negative regulator of sigma E activity
MSRLDDELKVAFQRQEPSADFTAHVLARLNEAPAPQVRPTLWQRFAGVFAMPALRYAAVGAMALLLIIIGLTLLRSQRTAGVENNPPQVAGSPGNPASEKRGTGSAAPDQSLPGKAATGKPEDGTNASTSSTAAQNHAELSPRPIGGRRQIHHHAPVIARQTPPSAEAEAAKEKVLFALQITSEALNDVQRAISDDRPNDEKPEPVQNR